MKKLALLLTLIITFSAIFCILSIPSLAVEDNFKGEVGAISVPSASPVIDGNIGKTEGWSAPKYIDKSNMDGFWNGEEIRVSFNYYCAWDNNGIYLAADITMPELILSTGEDNLDRDKNGNNIYGYNGDVFIVQFDPFGRFNKEGLGDFPTSWYCIGVFGQGDVRMIRTQFNKEELTSLVKIAGTIKASGWRFEAMIPWQIISEDITSASYGEFTYTPDELAKDGTLLNSSVIYQDRCFDEEKNYNRSYSRYVTICTTLPDGTPAVYGSGYYVKACGIYYTLKNKNASQILSSGTSSSLPQQTTGQSGALTQETASQSVGENAPATADTSQLYFIPALFSVLALGSLIFTNKNKLKQHGKER